MVNQDRNQKLTGTKQLKKRGKGLRVDKVKLGVHCMVFTRMTAPISALWEERGGAKARL